GVRYIFDKLGSFSNTPAPTQFRNGSFYPYLSTSCFFTSLSKIPSAAATLIDVRQLTTNSSCLGAFVAKKSAKCASKNLRASKK
ncbi:MAG: hypothetical protein Q8K40_07120, partial [Ignavibacteria bacterium]|nr:hypothetical protein [Ignavibacteria bacterium]